MTYLVAGLLALNIGVSVFALVLFQHERRAVVALVQNLLLNYDERIRKKIERSNTTITGQNENALFFGKPMSYWNKLKTGETDGDSRSMGADDKALS
jgi:hypothetical protein